MKDLTVQDLGDVAGPIPGQAQAREEKGREGEKVLHLVTRARVGRGRAHGVPMLAALDSSRLPVYPAPVMSAARPIAIIVISSGGGPPI